MDQFRTDGRPLPDSALQAHLELAPHLRAYLTDLQRLRLAEPAFFEELPVQTEARSSPNVLYPTGNGAYAHVYTRAGQPYPNYRVIEPDYGHDLTDQLARLERFLVEHSDRLLGSARAAKIGTAKALWEAVLASVDGQAPSAGQHGLLTAWAGRLSEAAPWAARLARGLLHSEWGPEAQPVASARMEPLPAETLEAVRYRITRDKIGMGVLQPMLLDPYIEDIRGNGIGPVFIVHKRFGDMPTDTIFDDEEQLDRFVLELAERIGRPVNLREPIVDATLTDGSRINIVFGRQISRKGSNFSIRRQADRPLSITQLADGNTLDAKILAYLSLVLGEGLNLFVAGEAASGKTTLMNALTAFLPPLGRIVTIEDTPELRLAHPNWVAESSRPARAGREGVSIFQLVKAALRQRPDAILVGEIRGEEALEVFQAMQTGHLCMSTVHADTVENVVQRLTSAPIRLPREAVANLHVVVVISNVKLPSGRRARRVVSISEVAGFDPVTDRVQYAEVFRWIPSRDQFLFTGESQTLEGRVAERRGLPPEQSGEIYRTLNQRSDWIERLLTQGVWDYADVYSEFARAHRQGLF